ncbi:MAG TPA: hypothetical protein P5159_17930 [Phycisphaerae bacterium]|nr:hypothetical protein [Phycisphaerae bacterium]
MSRFRASLSAGGCLIALSVAALVAQADIVNVHGQPMVVNVRVTAVRAGKIVYRLSSGREVEQPLEQVTYLQIAGWDAFNRAEKQQQDGAFRQAAEDYGRLLAKTPVQTGESLDRALLVRCRLIRVCDMDGRFDHAVAHYVAVLERMPEIVESLRPTRVPVADSIVMPAAFAAVDAAIERSRGTAVGESLLRWRSTWPGQKRPLAVSVKPPSTAPTSAPAPVSGRVPARVPALVTPSASTTAPAPVPARVPATVPARVPATAPALMPARVPITAPAPVPARVPATAPARVPASLPARVPATVPARVPATAPARVPATAQAVADPGQVVKTPLAEIEFLVNSGKGDEALVRLAALRNKPAGPVQAELFYWEGRAYLLKSDQETGGAAQQNARRAGLAFMRVVVHFPTSRLAPECLFRCAEIRRAAGDSDSAADLYSELLRSYPNAAPWSDRARQAVKR